MNIQPTYVTFEQAKLLKEKGFDEYCDSSFRPSNNSFQKIPSQNSILPALAAPEQWQVIEWLFKFHKIFITVDIDINGFVTYLIREWNKKDDAWEVRNSTSISEKYLYREEAYSAAFDYILTNLI
jgi:hypothetical protein